MEKFMSDNKALLKTAALFSQWREKNPGKRHRYPSDLRKLAVLLKQEHGQNAVVDQLKISPGTLHNWCHENNLPSKSSKKKKSKVTPFVEITPIEYKAAGMVDILLPGDICIKVGDNVSCDFIKNLCQNLLSSSL